MDKPNALLALGQTLALTAAGMRDPSAPLQFIQFQADQERKRKAMEQQVQDQQREAAFQNAIIGQVFGGVAGVPQGVQAPSQVAAGIPQAPQVQAISAAQSPPQSFQQYVQGQPPRLSITGASMGGLKFGPNPLDSANLDVQKQVATQKAKSQLTTEQALTNATLKIENSYDSFLDVANRTKELVPGVDPGLIGGTFSKIFGVTRANEFVEGFEGSLIEAAAAIGAIAIPGARAVRLVELFKKTGISINSTIESAIMTSADSFRQSITTDMSRNPSAYIEGWDGMSKQEQIDSHKQLTKMARDFEERFRDTLLKQAYQKNPELLKPETRKKYEQRFQDEQILTEAGVDPNLYEIVR